MKTKIFTFQKNGTTLKAKASAGVLNGYGQFMGMIIALALKSIVIDLAQEGFSQKDVEEYLTMKLEFMAKEVCATNTRLF